MDKGKGGEITDKEILAAITDKMTEDKQRLVTNIREYLKSSDNEENLYYRRINRIVKILGEKLFRGDTAKKIKSSDIFTKILCFMDFDPENIKTRIAHEPEEVMEELIGEVFKAFYVVFILSYLEGDIKDFQIPYIGRVEINEVLRYNPMWHKTVKYNYGRIRLDKHLREDLKRIEKEERLDILKGVFNKIEGALLEKMFANY